MLFRSNKLNDLITQLQSSDKCPSDITLNTIIGVRDGILSQINKTSNNINKTKVALALGLLCTGMASQAQWLTFNVSDALYDYFRSMRDYVQNTNLNVSDPTNVLVAQNQASVFNANTNQSVINSPIFQEAQATSTGTTITAD